MRDMVWIRYDGEKIEVCLQKKDGEVHIVELSPLHLASMVAEGSAIIRRRIGYIEKGPPEGGP